MSLNDSKIIEYPNYTFVQEYRIDKEGHIYSPWHGWKEMYQHFNKQGYKELYLYTNEAGRKCFKVHRLVMNTYNPIENSEQLQVNHKDGIKSNNNLDNLEWCTRSENLKHAFKMGLEEKPVGEKNPSHKLTENQVKEICSQLEQKVPLTELAKKYNVSKGTISAIKNGRTWTYISKNYNF